MSPSPTYESPAHAWDFEFDEKPSQQDGSDLEKSSSKATEIVSENDLCKNLQCKPHQVCLVEDDDVAVCISRRKLSAKENALRQAAPKKKAQTEDPCIPCPVLKPDFVCGSDNHTYSSVCRMEFRNCMHRASVAVSCKGFCPCKNAKNDDDKNKEFQMKDRWNRYMNKYQNTVKKPTSPPKSPKKNHSSNKIAKNSLLINDATTVSTDTMMKPSKSYHKVSTQIAEKNCNANELKAMGDRLLDWFSVVMADHRRGQSRRRSFRLSHTQLPDCKPEVSWMFQHLDTDGDLKLSLQELYDLENDEQEHCLRPYLMDCDADNDLGLSPQEWCACFDKSQRPCASALRRIPTGLVGGYTPVCDGEGYYLPTQCHTGSGTCWCVDRHGVEFTNTRRRGRPDCEGLLKRGNYSKDGNRDSDQEDDNNDDEEGSADRPLDF
ncbi:hypothetical protein JTE90_011862 [Oedothorax gibbosus]|uniref:Testican-3 n=1 Tax=Oedothorax gibbosus TaxID=931172 RepID=A0AAV6V634_9ARAC|nr:hypothetical protein JTE90_011862 [Oedothorax gibbosus]